MNEVSSHFDASSGVYPGHNPLLWLWGAPHGLPPFDRLKPGHFAPAFASTSSLAMRVHRQELRQIADQPDAPSFDNTVAAFAEVEPYFALDCMVEAAFDCATRLFGGRFCHRPDLPVYHPDVKPHEVLGADGAVRGMFLQDYFARTTKRRGEWMSGLCWYHRTLPGLSVLDPAKGRRRKDLPRRLSRAGRTSVTASPRRPRSPRAW